MARSFNGTSDAVTMDTVESVTNTRTAFSWAGWVKGAAQNNAVIISQSSAASTGNFFTIGTSSSSPFTAGRLLMSNSAGTTILSQLGTAVIMDSTWHHICWTMDASGNWVFYVDGAVDKSGTLASNTVTNNRCRLGVLTRSTGSANFFAGSILEVARWRRAIAAPEAAGLANGLPASFLNPDHYWPIWGADSPEPDIGGIAHVTGSLVGTTSVSGGRTIPDLLTI